MHTKRVILAGLIVAGSLVSFSLPATAQETNQSKATPATQAAKRDAVQEKLDQMTEKLGLTEAQRAKFKPILKEYNQKIRDLNKDKSLSKEARFAKFKEIREWGTRVMWAELTPDQVEKWKEGGRKRREAEAKQREEAQAKKAQQTGSAQKP